MNVLMNPAEPDAVQRTSRLASLPATELVSRYRRGDLDPVEVCEDVLAVIADREPVLNAFYLRDDEAALRDARASSKRWRAGKPAGPIDGVPMTLKENIARAGLPMPSGTAAGSPVVPEHNAPITDRVLEAGAVVLGSTTMPDWGMLSSGVSSLHGISRSPWDLRLTTGGSSAGAGAAAAGGYGPLHVGTDIGGSIRLPGTWLGLATLKPSNGRVPLHAPYFGRAAGPMARTVADLALLMQVIAQPDDRDWTQLPGSEIPWMEMDLPLSGLRVGWHVKAGAGFDADPEIAAAIAGAAQLFSGAGARVQQIEPFIDQQLLDELNLFWRVRSWRTYEALSAADQKKVLPFIVQWVSGAADTSGTRLMECYESTTKMAARTVAATADFDIVLSPVAPMAAFPAEYPMPWGSDDLGMQHIAFTVPYNISEQPAATVNCGFTSDGRTIGLQLAGRRFADHLVLQAAQWYENHRGIAATPRWPV